MGVVLLDVRRAVVGETVGLLAAALIFGVTRWATAPTWVPAFTGLPLESVGKMTEQLEGAGVQFRMEQGGYTQADLARVLGSRSRASEIMTGKAKSLSVSQIRRLNAAWHIPADVLIREAA